MAMGDAIGFYSIFFLLLEAIDDVMLELEKKLQKNLKYLSEKTKATDDIQKEKTSLLLLLVSIVAFIKDDKFSSRSNFRAFVCQDHSVRFEPI